MMRGLETDSLRLYQWLEEKRACRDKMQTGATVAPAFSKCIYSGIFFA